MIYRFLSRSKLRSTRNLLVQILASKHTIKRRVSVIENKMECPIEKSLNDKRNYRQILLDNGLKALLISDPDGADEVDMEADDLSDCESDAGSLGSNSEEDNEEDMEESEEEEEDESSEDKKSKEGRSAAALCIGVGNFSDPDDIPGFAHFLEHMVFMGSEKYPDENNFDDYLSKHGGGSNAWTDHEKTCFYFDVEKKHFSRSLDKFAHFFVNPLLLQDSVDREVEAVDSEFQERIPSDFDRSIQLLASTAKPDNPMSKFLIGNADTLKRIPAEKGIDVYGRLRDFYTRYYSAQYMTLAVHSKHSLDLLEEWVRESFSNIPNNGKPKETFEMFKEPFDTERFPKLYKVIPVQKTHSICITWAFPPLQKHYRVKPLDYISYLLTHEGKGSIYSYLKNKTWALETIGGNSGDGYDMNSTWSGFDVGVTLTDEGIKHVDDVIQVIFAYIEMMRKEGPLEWFFQEQKQVEEAKFRWKEQGNPTSYVEKICESMQDYPPEKYLTGHRLIFDYDHQLISDCLSHLRADNCNITVLSSNFTEAECSMKEPWFGTPYCVEEIGAQRRAAWTDVKTIQELSLPERNDYIVTDFSLKEVAAEERCLVPRLVSSSAHHKLFHKKDSKFNVPKGYVKMSLTSPVVWDTLKNSTLLSLFVAVVNQNIAEPTYPALLAGYSLAVCGRDGQTGIVVEVSGFNQKLKNVVDLLFDCITNLMCSDDLFEAIKRQQKKVYYNSMIKPYTASRMLRWSVMEKCYWPSSDKYRIIDGLTKEEMLGLKDSFLNSAYLEALVMGNLTQQEATNICDSVLVKVNPRVPVEESSVQNQVLQLPCEKLYCQIASFNTEDNNSCVYNYYQSGPGSMLKACLNELLATRMKEPCFNTLRTKLQLGYSVWNVNQLTCGIVGLGIVVECQANKFSMQYVDEKIEEFLLEMRDILASMTEEEFAALVETVVTMKKVEDTHLKQEVQRHWYEIMDGSYLFDRTQQEIVMLKTISLQQLRDWYEQEYLGDRQRKVSFQVIGLNNKTKASSDEGSGDNGLGFHCLLDTKQTKSTPLLNIQDFRRPLKLYPHTKIVS